MSKLFAKYLTSMTMVGSRSDTFPYKRGNCFSVAATDGREYRIVNFVAENFQALWKFDCKAPVRIKALSEKCAVIHDERIPHDWYSNHFCEVCCPESLLPMPQRLAIERDYLSGARKKVGETLECHDFTKMPRWERLKVD